jgi:adenosylcobinamide kinase/adenosylcobinamide-phosphate guanylyltransferase
MLAMKVLVTGGARSGKSRYAQTLAEDLGPRRCYLATAQALDEEMANRIDRHRRDRGPSWTTVEEPLDIQAHLARHPVVLVDCLTLWVSNLLAEHGAKADLGGEIDRLVSALAASPSSVVIVTNEVGQGIVPANPLARTFRDWSGIVAQRVARACDQVFLVCAGLPLRLK